MPEAGKRVIALGYFDGVHLGHAALLRRTAEAAAQLGLTPAALTFDTHPLQQILSSPVPLLNALPDRADLMRRLYGVEDVIFAHFDDALMRMEWNVFLEDMVVGRWGAAHVVAGPDFHFGHRGQGNPALLRARCAELGVGCDILPTVELEGITVSSTYIRKLVAQGEMERAARYLGHPHCLSGVVTRGRRLGSELGAPTVNLTIPPEVLNPARGVYVSHLVVDGQRYPAVTNIGVRPTVSVTGQVTVETSILNFSGDLYGRTVWVEYLQYLRPEERFVTLDELRRQIGMDLREAKRVHQIRERRG